ncbi:NAD(P)-dependent dehydrogenase (short-subunit alcohol dehydrogenase family) [Sphingomonas jejuensis]|uniref:NAD(P)-dependent dehydrogenase (Short-subunit alcohol dehydrogenase family) n=1 Tax=Sphingomonas jejuensis TaxID=904715 RepID=A0ABX0XMW2_9SPHN|nr:SDR family oxidoreductase [Sphingomonas jejuensis]NJC34579.1 NAD(P)-dependent dehydrogenase (short-subunit alcohol dehydrogenase family) [Sphingomonas jejuensis]
MSRWTVSDIPPQQGRTAVVTGAGGLGFEDALALARAGADVIVASRDPMKGSDAVGRIHATVPGASVRFERLDLADLRSVHMFADRLAERHDRLDLLINNAGVMVPPARSVTADGFELQMGTNYLGHFALTGRLLPLLKRAPAARVVSLSSIAAPQGAIDFDDLNAEKGYRPMPVYAQSKLACLMFAFELQRRSAANGWGVTSIAAHPGVARTDLLHNGPGRSSLHGLVRSFLPFLFQPVAQGALPTLFAATATDAVPGGYYGPDRLAETRGHPTAAKVPPQARDEAVAERLWRVSEAMTGVIFDKDESGRRAAPKLVGITAAA